MMMTMMTYEDDDDLEFFPKGEPEGDRPQTCWTKSLFWAARDEASVASNALMYMLSARLWSDGMPGAPL